MPRPSTAIERNALKTAFKQLVGLLGGLAASASCTRVEKTQIGAYGVVHAEAQFVPIDVLLDLERIAGTPLVTEALARAQGFLLVPIDMPGEGDVAEALQQVATGAGQTLSDALRALTAGGPDMPADEREVMEQDLVRLVRASSHALSLIKRRPPPLPAVVRMHEA